LYSISCTSTSEHETTNHYGKTEGSSAVATEILQNDSEILRRVLQLLEKAAYCLEIKKDKQVTKKTFIDIIEIINNFTDKSHREKQDDILFPFIKSVRGGTEKRHFLGQLLMEHISARDMMRNLSVAVDNIYMGKKAKKKIIKISRKYIKFMKKHIEMEEKVLFPWLNKLLSPEEQSILVDKLKSLEDEYIRKGLYKKYSIILDNLEKQLNTCQ